MDTKQIKVLDRFIGIKSSTTKVDWNYTMRVVDKIESIIEHAVDIANEVSIAWWYSPKKTGTFEKGFGGGGGHTIKRTPFESIFGKFYEINVYYQKGIQFKTKKNELADSKLEAVLLACFRWIGWYNKTLKKNEK